MTTKKMFESEWNQVAAESDHRIHALAKLLGPGPRQLERIIRRDLGSKPRSWLNQRRLIEAQARLLAGGQVKTVASDLGYRQQSHFSRQFKEHYGISPSEFAATHPKNAEMSHSDTKCRPEVHRIV